MQLLVLPLPSGFQFLTILRNMIQRLDAYTMLCVLAVACQPILCDDSVQRPARWHHLQPLQLSERDLEECMLSNRVSIHTDLGDVAAMVPEKALACGARAWHQTAKRGLVLAKKHQLVRHQVWGAGGSSAPARAVVRCHIVLGCCRVRVLSSPVALDTVNSRGFRRNVFHTISFMLPTTINATETLVSILHCH
jgi:hypothetical protein